MAGARTVTKMNFRRTPHPGPLPMNRSADFQIGTNRADLEVGAPLASVQGFNSRILRRILSPSDGERAVLPLRLGFHFETAGGTPALPGRRECDCPTIGAA